MILNGDQPAAGLPARSDERVRVDRLHRVRVDYGVEDSLLPQEVVGSERLEDGDPRTHYGGDVARALAQHLSRRRGIPRLARR